MSASDKITDLDIQYLILTQHQQRNAAALGMKLNIA
jgi:hypothetical protein